MIGKVYTIPPQPPVPENTRYFTAGVVTIGVEYRDVDPDGLVATYQDRPEQLAELLARSPAGGFSDEGVSLHICDAKSGHEYLRFDVFDGDPHYHYVSSGPDIVNNVIEFDPDANGDMLVWTIDRIRFRLGPMLERAGGGHLVAHLDQTTIDAGMAEVSELAQRAQQAHRAFHQGEIPRK
jgi:hypothetical protein